MHSKRIGDLQEGVSRTAGSPFLQGGRKLFFEQNQRKVGDQFEKK
jgi:hypothetical protein